MEGEDRVGKAEDDGVVLLQCRGRRLLARRSSDYQPTQRGRKEKNEWIRVSGGEFALLYPGKIPAGLFASWAGLKIQIGPKFFDRFSVVSGRAEMGEIHRISAHSVRIPEPWPPPALQRRRRRRGRPSAPPPAKPRC
jgi:hypothetical protein